MMMGIEFKFGIAIGLCAMAWMIASFSSALESFKWKLGSAFGFALVTGFSAVYFWDVGKEVVSNIAEEKLSSGLGSDKGSVPVGSVPVESVLVNAVDIKSGDMQGNSKETALKKKREDLSVMGDSKSGHSSSSASGDDASSKHEKKDHEKSAKDRVYTIPFGSELSLGIIGFIIAIVSGVYLVSLQNALHAGREVVKDLAAQRAILTQELKDVALIKRQRVELAGALAAAIQCETHNVIEICARLELQESDAQIKDDYGKLGNSLGILSSELEWVTRASNLLDALYGCDFSKADSESCQLRIYLENPHVRTPLIMVAIRPIRDYLELLQRSRDSLFDSSSRYPELSNLLDQLIKIDHSA